MGGGRNRGRHGESDRDRKRDIACDGQCKPHDFRKQTSRVTADTIETCASPCYNTTFSRITRMVTFFQFRNKTAYFARNSSSTFAFNFSILCRALGVSSRGHFFGPQCACTLHQRQYSAQEASLPLPAFQSATSCLNWPLVHQ